MNKKATHHEASNENLQIVASVTLEDALRALGIAPPAPMIANEATL